MTDSGNGFELHPRLAADSIEIGRMPLCRVLLINDSHYPWLVLVPERTGMREIHDLSEADQQRLLRETSHVSSRLQAATRATKMNVAALGNQVPQLHIHVIARFETDAAWPGPVWGCVPATAWPPEKLAAKKAELRELLELD